MDQTDVRYCRGTATMNAISGEAGRQMVEDLRALSPDLADWAVCFGYGDVLAREQLDRRTRQLATIAALTALGNSGLQLRAHIHGSLNVGCTPDEIVETVIQMAVFAGFPAAINGITAAREVFTARGVSQGARK